MKVTLVRITDEPKNAMASAGSNCYDAVPNEAMVDFVYKSGHHSILEFATVHFHIEGVSRALTHQLVRHRIASYAQRSQRYVTENNFEYVTPPSIAKDWNYLTFYEEFMEKVQNDYNTLVKFFKIPAEDARFILPNATCSNIDVSMNFREFMNFCHERLCMRAQWEIRQMAKEMVECVVAVAPELEKYLVPKCELHYPYCFCTEEKSCGKHPKLEQVFHIFNTYRDVSSI